MGRSKYDPKYFAVEIFRKIHCRVLGHDPYYYKKAKIKRLAPSQRGPSVLYARCARCLKNLGIVDGKTAELASAIQKEES